MPSGKKKIKEMAEETAKSKLRQIFPKGAKAPKSETRAVSVGELGKSLEQNDPETLKFIGKHKVEIHGEKPKVATSYSLENEKNARLKGHGKKKERDVYEAVDENGVCTKCHAKPCQCKDKSEGEPAYKKDKALLLGGKKLREDTTANRIAMEIFETRKQERLDETLIPPPGMKKPKTKAGSTQPTPTTQTPILLRMALLHW